MQIKLHISLYYNLEESQEEQKQQNEFLHSQDSSCKNISDKDELAVEEKNSFDTNATGEYTRVRRP